MKQKSLVKIGSLVKTNKAAHRSLMHPPLGLGIVCEYTHKSIVYVQWKTGKPQPINVIWLEVVDEEIKENKWQ